MKKRYKILITISFVIILTVICLLPFTAVSFPDIREAGDCFSIVFDRRDVLTADKLVLKVGDKKYTVTDKETVRDIAEDFLVANRSGLCGYHQDKWLEIYKGEKLVRNVHWNDHEDLAVIYKEDLLHIVSPFSEGQIQISPETLEKLKEIENQTPDSF